MAQKRQDPSVQQGKSITRTLVRKSFKLGEKQVEDGGTKSTEETVDQVGKQRLQGHVHKNDLLFSKRALKGTPLKCMFPDKEVSIQQHKRGSFHTFSGK